MSAKPPHPPLPDSSLQDPPSRTRVRFGLIVFGLGFFILLIGAKPAWFGWDNSPVIGFIQVAVMLVGLGILSLGGYASLLPLWGGRERSIAADIGMRLVATGYVVAVFAGMADLFGMGTQVGLTGPFFGPLQSRGIVVGQVIIAVGLALMIPFREKPNGKEKIS